MSHPKYRWSKRCIFCQKPADSKEHGFSAWAIKRYITDKHRIAGFVDGKPHFDRTQKAIKIPCVCRVDCNNGWMKELEDAVIPLVGRMGEAKRTPLDILQQWTVARWAVVKSMVWEYVSHESTFYADEERFGLRDGTIPPNTVVWLGGHVGTETLYAKAGNLGSRPGTVPQLNGHITTFAYERIVIQVLSVRPYEHTDPYALINCNQRVWADAIIRIWPTASAAYWPPRFLLGDDMLDTFHQRCDSEQHGNLNITID